MNEGLKKDKTIDADSSFPTKDKKIVNASVIGTGKEKSIILDQAISQTKEKEDISSVSAYNEKEKVAFTPLKIEESKKNFNISSLKTTIEKSKVTFTPLKIEEEKNKVVVTPVNIITEKTKTIIPSQKIIDGKKKVITYAEQTERKNGVELSYSTIENLKDGAKLSYSNIENLKNGAIINGEFELKSKEKGEDLLTSPIIYSKNDIPISADFTEHKEDVDIEHEPQFEQKEDVILEAYSNIEKEGVRIIHEPDFEQKDGANISPNPKFENKEDVTVEAYSDVEREEINLLENFVLENKEDFDIAKELTLENKEEIKIINGKINQLLESEDPKRDTYAKEKVKGFFKQISNIMNTISLGMEGDLARVLAMPYELDSAANKRDNIARTLKKGGVANTISGISGIAGMVGGVANQLSTMSAGELIAYYAADFYTMQTSKPSPTIKTPGAGMASSLLGTNDYSGQILLGADDGTGEIGGSAFGKILGKISFLSNTKNLKSFVMNQAKNLVGKAVNKLGIKSNVLKKFGLDVDTSGFDNQTGNQELKEKKEEYQVNVDPWRYPDDTTKEYDYGTIKEENIQPLYKTLLDYGKINPLKTDNKQEVYVQDKDYNTKPVTNLEEAKFNYGTIKNGEEDVRKASDVEIFGKKNPLKSDHEIKIETVGGMPDSIPQFDFSKSQGNKNKEKEKEINSGIQEAFTSVDYRNDYSLGYMLIQPVMPNDKYPVFKIDFEFNPKISEGSIKANYSALSILNRIGDLQTYTGTSSVTPQIDLKYRVLSNNSTKGTSWMSKWTLEYIQKIELALRSLAVPSLLDNNERSTRPPIIRVNLGKNSNIFQFPSMVYGGQRFRYFVASSVEIDKNYDGSGYYLKSDNLKNLYAGDTMGFDAKISLIEVKRSYFTRYPSFNDYYDAVTTGNSKTLSYFGTQETF